MTSFKNYIQKILREEISKTLEQQSYILETSFCQKICSQYDFDIHTIRPAFIEICSGIPLIKRRLSNDLKRFYKLEELKGCPIIYISNK